MSIDALEIAEIDSPVGPLLAGACPRGVCLLEFGAPARRERAMADLGRFIGDAFHVDQAPESCAHLALLREELAAYFAGELTEFTVPLHAPGTEFQTRVWARMRRIACGRTLSYAALAEDIGSPGGARAVGAASGQNRIAILIPCHRVVEAGGGLRGYGGGLANKRWLLEHEAAMTGEGSLFGPVAPAISAG